MRFETHWIDAIVRTVTHVTPEVCQIEIVPVGGAPGYAPGSHIQVGVAIGVAGAERWDMRCYSLVGQAPINGSYRIAVRHRPGSRGGSRYMWSLRPGARLRITPPHNFFELGLGRRQYLLIAGGIGITPILGMAYTLQQAGADFRLLYCARSRAGLPFLDELSERLGHRLAVFCSEEGSRIDLGGEIHNLHPAAEVYMCGPMELMDAVRATWKDEGRPDAHLRFETFGSSGRFASEPFLVKVKDRKLEVVVPEDKTMLEALQEAGVDMMYDCMRGECGLCAIDVLEVEGELDHRDVFLSLEERTAQHRICTCVSRSVGGYVAVDTGYRGVESE